MRLRITWYADAGCVGPWCAEQAADGLVGDARRLDVARGERRRSERYPPRRLRSAARSMMSVSIASRVRSVKTAAP
ncbi:hypothetical protein [Sorangium sp. So ce204]|uniref:hypothetical protein n=1 Tax=Sorangium sp. So ce204 TaxID=3133288 RepID=UPI003F60CEF4